MYKIEQIYHWYTSCEKRKDSLNKLINLREKV